MIKNIFVGILGLFSLIYLINPTAGILEFVPDNIPFVGNVDEGFAAFLLISSLRYFGLDFSKIFERKH